jgi:hypothetical protein
MDLKKKSPAKIYLDYFRNLFVGEWRHQSLLSAYRTSS